MFLSPCLGSTMVRWGCFLPSFLRSLLFLLESSGLVFCQHGVNSGLCSCQPLENPPNQSTIAWYSFRLKDYDTCPNNIIRFKLPKTTVCGTTFDDWVQKLKTCFDAKNFTECRKKVPKTNMDTNIISTTVDTTSQDQRVDRSSTWVIHKTQTDISLDLMVKTSASIHNDETDLTGQDSTDKIFQGLADIVFTSPAPSGEDKIKKMTVTIISLLGIIFILVGITTFLICRRRAGALKKSKMKYSYVEQLEGYPS